ncbi:MAG: ABC transporter ATP-binding protein, partial [Acidobacteria bacterium]|nr:ABC transporter ATP-binding protein [Acidobacteriota bacterium]
MKPLLRLLGYARPYWLCLLASIVLMAVVGAAHGAVALLAGPIFDRVLDPASPDTRVALFTDPLFQRTVYL